MRPASKWLGGVLFSSERSARRRDAFRVVGWFEFGFFIDFSVAWSLCALSFVALLTVIRDHTGIAGTFPGDYSCERRAGGERKD